MRLFCLHYLNIIAEEEVKSGYEHKRIPPVPMGGVGEEEETWRNPFKRFQHSVFTYKYCSKTTNLRVIDSSVLSILSSSLLASVLNFLPYILVLFKVVLSFLSAFQGGGNL